MDAVKFLREREKMCDKMCNFGCSFCSMHRNKVNFNILNKNECNEFIFKHPQCAVEIIDDEYTKRLARDDFQAQINAYYGG